MKAFKTLLLTGAALVTFAGAAMANSLTPAEHLTKAYDQVTAASTEIQSQKADAAIKDLKVAKAELEKSSKGATKEEKAENKEWDKKISSVETELKGKTPDFAKAGSDVQKIGEAVHARVTALPAAPAVH